MKKNIKKYIFFLYTGIFLMGCQSVDIAKDQPQSLYLPTEAEWIRNGEPIEFEGAQWFPEDNIENILDSELYRVAEYKGVFVFIEAVDVKPYDKLYTRFARNKYRSFAKKEER